MFKQAFVEALSKSNPHLKNYIYIWCNNDSTGVPMEISSPQYRIAFEQYLRRGTPIDLTLKQARTTTNYIWRTRKDRKVRASHAANDGKIFAWNNPPSTGHPGDEFGCRCTAEPYYGAGQETMSHTLHGLTSAGPRWENNDFVWHFFTGNGRSLSLSQIGHLYEIANYWAYGLSIFQTSVFMLYISMGKIKGGTAPIFPTDMNIDPAVLYSNPLPHVLILTAIVVGVATTALGLALIVRIREEYDTIEEQTLLSIEREMVRKENSEHGDAMGGRT